MDEPTSKPIPSGLPPLTRASDLPPPARRSPSDALQVRKDRFRLRFCRALDQSGLSLAELAARSSVDEAVLRRWTRLGVANPSHDHLLRVAKAFGLGDPRSLFDDGESEFEAARRTDRQTNPAVDDVRADRPALFEQFTPEDWDELYSSHGTGGPLTYDGAVEAALKINRKRELRRKFEAVLETHHFDTLASLVELMYDQSRLD
jgi:transcriptional regulator with XRE-family HTH domain